MLNERSMRRLLPMPAPQIPSTFRKEAMA